MLAVLVSIVLALSPIMTVEMQDAEARFVVDTVAGTGSHGAQDGNLAQFNLPGAVFGGLRGELFVADTFNNLIRAIDDNGNVRRRAGDVFGQDAAGFPVGVHRDGHVENALLNRPTGGAVGPQGWIFVADSQSHAIRVIMGSEVLTFSGNGEPGHVDGAAEYVLFDSPSDVVFGPCGHLFVADTLNHVIRRIDMVTGRVTTVAGTPGQYGHRDGTRRTSLFNSPMGLVVGRDGTIFVADTGNHLIRAVDGRTGRVSTLTGTLVFPGDLDWGDDVDWEELGFDDVPLGGFADGEEAMFNLPMGLTLWGDVLLVADSANHRIRAVMPCGETFTLAGTGDAAFVDGCAAYAAFHFPRDVFARGNRLYIADSGNNVIRVLYLYFDKEAE
jgi:sugar lactone lactonase YvrE